MKKYLLLSLAMILFLSGAAPYPDEAVSACTRAYGMVPTQTLPKWLQTQVSLPDLATQSPYELLAGHLLAGGWVDAKSCASGGLNADGSPDGCGSQVAQNAVIAWQNRYDPAILSASQTGSLPPYLLKAMIAVESQFWPAPDWVKGEIGLGQMTAYGADLLLSYRPAYLRQVCSQILSAEGCRPDYASQPDANRAMLRGAVLRSLDATCPTCQGGIDPAKGDQAVAVLAETLEASCSQSAHIFTLATGQKPAALLSYEDFWRFVLANYHSGAGCMFQAVRRSGNPTRWAAIAADLPVGCTSGAAYIRRVEEAIKP